MRKPSGVVFGLCVALCPQFAAATDHSGEPHWIQDAATGCWIYNAEPQHDESIVWKGPNCAFGGEANGEGTVTWFQYNSWTLVEKGVLQDGKMSGAWIRRWPNGNSETSYWAEGVRQQDNYADQGGDSGGDQGSSYSPVYDGNAYMETLKRQNRENCERAAKGADIACHPE